MPSGLMKTSPSFHLLVPASQKNPNLCKTLFSAFVLSYPSPTLVNYGKVFDESKGNIGSHTAKIRGVSEFLNDDKKVNDNDLVLIVDGYDVWFQLPPEVLIERYHSVMNEANERLRARYGMILKDPAGKSDDNQMVQKYTQKILFAADKACSPNPAQDPACAAVPYSTLPKDTYGPMTDKDPHLVLSRPRYLNSGTIVGPVAEVRQLYEYALKKVEEEDRGIIGDQFVFAEIFGEQEYQREMQRKNSQEAPGRWLWLDWISDALGKSESPLSANITINNMTTIAGQNYEFSIGLDYESSLFQTMTRSTNDIEYITYNDSYHLSEIQGSHPSLLSRPLSLPVDLQRAKPPFWYSAPGNHSNDPKDTILLPFSAKLDYIVHQPSSWFDVPLATNLFASTLPSLLHFNGDAKPKLKEWWPLMWYSSSARALLRRYIRSSTGANAARSAAEGGLDWWDTRGGRGGIWTDKATWMSWGEVCKGTEEVVFADGKGVWGKEEGDGRVVNEFGKVISGGDEQDDANNAT